MLKHPKAKGTRLENEVKELFNNTYGCTGERCWASNGESRGLAKEVDVVATYPEITKLEGRINSTWKRETLYIQCKSVAKLAAKFVPSKEVDAVVYKENRGEKYILFRLDDFVKRFL